MYIEDTENVRKWALGYGLTFADTYQDAPFHDPNWQLVRVKQSRKAFLYRCFSVPLQCSGVKA